MSSQATEGLTRYPAVKRPCQERSAHSTSIRPNWALRLQELEAFKKEHGHCDVPHNYVPNPPLANWVSYVRNRKRSGRIAAELASRLDGLGFTWMLRRRSAYRRDWDAMVVALTAFKNKHGHCRVPVQPATYQALGLWLTDVRRRKRRGLLERGRIQQLERLGVSWEPNRDKWEDRFAELVAYRAKYGDCKVPGNWPENRRLASWVIVQRQARRQKLLTQDRLERLDKIGFVWKAKADAWEAHYAALVKYKQVHGHCQVSTQSKDHASLGNWVRTMRGCRKRGKLSEERIRRLTELGFVWSVRQDATAVCREPLSGRLPDRQTVSA